MDYIDLVNVIDRETRYTYIHAQQSHAAIYTNVKNRKMARLTVETGNKKKVEKQPG